MSQNQKNHTLKKSSLQHNCPHCKKDYALNIKMTWVFDPFCSRKCQDHHLVNWLVTQTTDTNQNPHKSKQ